MKSKGQTGVNCRMVRNGAIRGVDRSKSDERKEGRKEGRKEEAMKKKGGDHEEVAPDLHPDTFPVGVQVQVDPSRSSGASRRYKWQRTATGGGGGGGGRLSDRERERERERVSAGERWGRWWWCRREMVVVAEEKVEDLVEEPVEEELVAMKEVKEVEEVEEVEEEGSARPAVRPGKNVRAHSNRSSAGARTRSAVFPRHGRSSFLLVPTARLPSHLLAGAFGLVSRRVDQSYKARLRAWDLDVGARASRCCCCRRCFCRRGCHRVRGRRAMRAPLD
jgi:hypothetical protein